MSPIVRATLSLTGSQVVDTVSDSQGKFRFSNLPTSGSYTVGVAKPGHTFTSSSQTVVHPAGNLIINFPGRSNRDTITGRITRADGTGIGGVTLTVQQLPTTYVTSDQNGDYALPELAPGGSYTVIPVSADFLFSPQSATFHDLSANKVRISQADRVGTRSAGESRQLTAQDWVACVTFAGIACNLCDNRCKWKLCAPGSGGRWRLHGCARVT